MDELLKAVKNYLDITWEDDDTDAKLTGIIERGKTYLDRNAGTAQDYETEGLPRALLFDYCRYVRNNALELFEENFRGDLIALRMGAQADEYAEQQGYI
jgi:hypothetical protein